MAPVVTRSQRFGLEAERRSQLLAAARSVFAERGYEGATVADIAGEAGVAVGSVYTYFGSKSEIFFALNQDFQRMFGKAIRQSHDPQQPFTIQLTSMVHAVFQCASQNPDLVRLLSFGGESVPREVQAAFLNNHPTIQWRTDMFDRAIAAGEMLPMNSAIAARLTYGLIKHAIQDAFLFQDEVTTQDYEESLSQLLINALASRPSPYESDR